jgi:hypothetical protein
MKYWDVSGNLLKRRLKRAPHRALRPDSVVLAGYRGGFG